jgi:hypothetical protein
MDRKLFYRICVTILIIAPALIFSGCARDDDPYFEAYIMSDQDSDGDIAYDAVRRSFTISQGPDFLFFGIDRLSPNHPEYRAFLDFPLDGAAGDDVVPARAKIVSATLEIFIDHVSFASIIPARIDLVNYPAYGLRKEDFVSAPFASQSLDFFASDYGRFVSIDVTHLMRQAQRLGLPEFQVRLLLHPDADYGLVGIADLPTVSITAPLLNVVYRF